MVAVVSQGTWTVQTNRDGEMSDTVDITASGTWIF